MDASDDPCLHPWVLLRVVVDQRIGLGQVETDGFLGGFHTQETQLDQAATCRSVAESLR
jgi:hypothetical protein